MITTIAIEEEDHKRFTHHMMMHSAKIGKRISQAEMFNKLLNEYERGTNGKI